MLCGERLSFVRARQPGRAKFCSECAAALAAEPLAHDERTVVMVLPPTWWGSPPKPEQLDPEDVGALLPPFYARLRTEPKRFGGTAGKVHRGCGDGPVRGTGRA